MEVASVSQMSWAPGDEGDPLREKYDRQLRLWGQHGQRELSRYRVCCFGSGAAACETLKNLILPGVGFVCVVDDTTLSPQDTQSNFFAPPEMIGQMRASSVLPRLLELNADVKGTAITKSPSSLLSSEEGTEFLRGFHCVVIANVATSEIIRSRLSDICYKYNLLLVFIETSGFIGVVHFAQLQHPVVEAREEGVRYDLRITKPFEELVSHVDSINLDELTDMQHGHVTFAVLLIKALQLWRRRYSKKESEIPASIEEKKTYNDVLRSMRRSTNEVNFDEALRHAHYAFDASKIPPNIATLLERGREMTTLPSHHVSFWIITKAVERFVRACKQLPLSGAIPDMTGDTQGFMLLQKIYRDRAEGDVAAVTAHVEGVLQEFGKVDSSVVPSHDEIARYCKNAAQIHVMETRSLQNQLSPEGQARETLNEAIAEWQEDHTSNEIPWWLAMRSRSLAMEKLQSISGTQEASGIPSTSSGVPSGDDESEDSILASLQVQAAALFDTWKLPLPGEILVDYLKEIVRGGTEEFHPTCGCLGGMASQEIIKFATKQFLPSQSTIVWNGIHSRASTFNL